MSPLHRLQLLPRLLMTQHCPDLDPDTHIADNTQLTHPFQMLLANPLLGVHPINMSYIPDQVKGSMLHCNSKANMSCPVSCLWETDIIKYMPLQYRLGFLPVTVR